MLKQWVVEEADRMRRVRRGEQGRVSEQAVVPSSVWPGPDHRALEQAPMSLHTREVDTTSESSRELCRQLPAGMGSMWSRLCRTPAAGLGRFTGRGEAKPPPLRDDAARWRRGRRARLWQRRAKCACHASLICVNAEELDVCSGVFDGTAGACLRVSLRRSGGCRGNAREVVDAPLRAG
jgi:hypothetical protein